MKAIPPSWFAALVLERNDHNLAMFVNKSISATSLSSVMTVTGSIVQWATSSHLPLLHASKYLGWTEYVMLPQMLQHPLLSTSTVYPVAYTYMYVAYIKVLGSLYSSRVLLKMLISTNPMFDHSI